MLHNWTYEGWLFYCAALTWVDLHLKKIWVKELYMFANHFRLFDWSIPKFNPLGRKWVQIKHFEEGSDKKPNVTHVSILIDTLPGCKTNKTCRWLILSYCREIECVKFNPLILRLERGLKLKIPKKLATYDIWHFFGLLNKPNLSTDLLILSYLTWTLCKITNLRNIDWQVCSIQPTYFLIEKCFSLNWKVCHS